MEEKIEISLGIYIVCWLIDIIYKKTVVNLLSNIEKKIQLSYELGDV